MLYANDINMGAEYACMDPKIRKLVHAINRLGVKTFWSCEGHKSYTLINSPFPAVGIMIKDLSSAAIFKLFEIVGYFNKECVHSFNLSWYIEPHPEYLMLRPEYISKEDLEGLQTQADELAEFIYKVLRDRV